MNNSGSLPGEQIIQNGSVSSSINISPFGNIFFLALGILLLVIVLIAARYELRYLSFAQPKPFVKGLSIFSIILMMGLAFICIFHVFINFAYLVGLVGLLVILLLVITPVQFVLRMRSFRELTYKRIDEKARLIREVRDILDESKRKRFIESDASMTEGRHTEGEGNDKETKE